MWRGCSAFPEVAVLESSPGPSSALDLTASHPLLPNVCLAPGRCPAQKSAYLYTICEYSQVPFYLNFLGQQFYPDKLWAFLSYLPSPLVFVCFFKV